MSEKRTPRHILVLDEAPLDSAELRIIATNYEMLLRMVTLAQPDPETAAEQVRRLRALTDWLDRIPKIALDRMWDGDAPDSGANPKLGELPPLSDSFKRIDP